MKCITCNNRNTTEIEIAGTYINNNGVPKQFDGTIPICYNCRKSVVAGIKYISIGEIIKRG